MRALISTSDKSGLIEFLKPLVSSGLEIISTGGTYEYLKQNQLTVQEVTELTGFPEVLDGRVKTLHPKVHMGILADLHLQTHQAQLKEHQIKPFDLVVGNLYPFETAALNLDSTEQELIEKIDIGGPSFLRAAAKNFKSVIVLCDPADYSWVQQKIVNKTLTVDDRKQLALKVFSLTSYYDALIVQRLQQGQEKLKYLNLPLKLKQKLRYGENPQQQADWFENPLEIKSSLAQAQQLQGKELSYNNLLDLDSCLQLIQKFNEPCCVAVKHNNTCGAAVAENLKSACMLAIESDPKSIFGGIVALNRPVDGPTSQILYDIFLECIIAPDFTEEAKAILSSKKNLRLLTISNFSNLKPQNEIKSISGGVLWQQHDQYNSEFWNSIQLNFPMELKSSFEFSEKIVGSLKSNAIAIVQGRQTIGLGMGQVNRVDAVHQALMRMEDFCKRNNSDRSKFILASDAFFPFADSIEIIAKAGIRYVLQPGGSIQDAVIKSAAEKHGVHMVLTGQRHFKH